MMDGEKDRKQPALWDEDIAKEESNIPPESPPPKILLTRKAVLPWMYAALAAPLLTFVALLLHLKTSQPDQWGLRSAAWANKDPLIIPLLICLLLGFILNRLIYGIPLWDKSKELPDILAYYPRNLWEAGRIFFVLFNVAIMLAAIYLGELVIYVECFRMLSKFSK